MDFSEYSCDDLYAHAQDKLIQCAYARTCNDGDGIFAPVIYCSEQYSSRTLILLLSVPMALLLIILFRILGSTAEEFFSPGLEMFSIKLGLPERFAGVTLLALGNGAPDVASTVNAIRNDRKRGYLLALGELTGAAMVASTLIVGAVAFVSAEPVPCRGAFVRDVLVFIITMLLVFSAFNDGTIDPKEVRMFAGLYLAYVLVVLAADVYHRSGVQAEQSEEEGEMSKEERPPNETTALKSKEPSRQVIEAISNYDENPGINERPIMDTEQQQEDPLDSRDRSQLEHKKSSGWGEKATNGTEPLMVFHPHHGGIVDLKHTEPLGASQEEGMFRWLEIRQELADHFANLWNEMFYSDQFNVVEKLLMTCEAPFTILRMVSWLEECSGCRLIHNCFLLTTLLLRNSSLCLSHATVITAGPCLRYRLRFLLSGYVTMSLTSLISASLNSHML